MNAEGPVGQTLLQAVLEVVGECAASVGGAARLKCRRTQVFLIAPLVFSPVWNPLSDVFSVQSAWRLRFQSVSSARRNSWEKLREIGVNPDAESCGGP
jgi:hypothetical protein